MRVLRLKVHEYVHVLDNNTCEVLTLLGPLCYTLREHHTLVHTTPQPCVVVPPGCYVVVHNPVTRSGPEVSDGATATAAAATTTMRAPSVTGTEHGSEGRTTTATTAAATAAIAYELITTQSSLLRRPTRAVAHVGGCEYRFTQPPFALFPGEWATRPQRLCLLAADEALVLRVKAAFVDRVVSAHSNSDNSSDSDGDSNNTKDVAMTVVHRREGDEYLFCGPGLYYPHVRESVTRRVRALRLRRGEAVHVCARRAHVDVVTGDKRVAGEEWQEDARVSTRRCARDAASSSSAAAASSWPHIHTPRAAHGLYFVAPDCRVVRVLQPHAVTRSTALCVCARTSHYDARAQRHRAAGTRWLVTYEDTTKGSSNNNNNNNNGSSEHAAADDVMTMPGQYTPRYTEDVVGTVALTVLCARQYALITRGSAHTAATTTIAAAVAADNDAHTQPSPPVQRRVGPCAFFLQPGECLVGGTAHDALVLERDEAVLVEATTAAARIQLSPPTTSATAATAAAVTRTDGDADDTAVSVRSRWLVRGPRVYIPDVGVRVCERRRVLPLHPLEGVYVRNTRTGQVRSVVGQPLLLDADEQLWHKPLSPFVRRLLRSPGLTRRASAPRALPRDTTHTRGNSKDNNNNNKKNVKKDMKKKKSGNDDDDAVDEADDSDAAEWVPPHTVLPGDDDDDSSNSSSSSSEDDDDACDDGDNKKHTTPTEASARRRRRRRRSAAVVLAKIEPHTLARVVDVGAGVSRVVHGPAAVLLAPHEELAVLSLSGGTPKRPAQIASLRLFLGPDYAADDVDVQTRDHARWRLRVAYSWSFDAQTVAQQPAVALAARDCLRVACRALASRIRARVARAPFAHFHRHAAAIVHDAVFGSSNNNSDDSDDNEEDEEKARCGGDVPHDTTTTTQASNDNNSDNKRTDAHDHSSRRSRSRNRSSRCSVSDAVTRRDSDGALCFVAMALRVTNVEVQSVEAVDAQTRLALMRSVQLAVEIITRTQESEATHRAMTLEQQAAGARERQVVLDKAAAEEVRVALLRVVAHNTAVEQTGASRAQALAEAHAREREAHAELDATPLRCGVHEATADAEHAMLRRHAALDVAHRSAMNALAVDKARALADVAARKYEAIMAALGTDTLLALAQAGPALQARLLAALGLQGYLVLDGTAPVHLLHTATQLTNTSSSSSSSSTLTSPHATNNKDKAPPA